MQQRTFLSNEMLVRNATRDISFSLLGADTGDKPCEDYVLECKQNKAYDKLDQLKKQFKFNNYYNILFRNRILHCRDKDEFIRFLHFKFNTLIELKNFFNSFNK